MNPDTSAPPTDYQRVTWVTCGHSADAPADHDWKHRHWCPIDEPDQVDEHDPCPGIDYRNINHVPPVETTAACFLCGDEPAKPYPVGVRCDDHSPAAMRAQQDLDDGMDL